MSKQKQLILSRNTNLSYDVINIIAAYTEIGLWEHPSSTPCRRDVSSAGPWDYFMRVLTNREHNSKPLIKRWQYVQEMRGGENFYSALIIDFGDVMEVYVNGDEYEKVRQWLIDRRLIADEKLFAI